MYAGTEYPFQGRLRVGDLNIDGYPEVFLTLVLKDRINSLKSYRSMILVNTACTAEHCPQIHLKPDAGIAEQIDPETNRTKEHRPRRFYSTIDYEEDKTQVVNIASILEFTGPETSMIAAVDIDEDGKLDILCQKYSEKYAGLHDIEIIYNNQYLDSFFLKALMIIDHSHSTSLHPDSFQLSERRYGDMSIGATFRFVTTDYFDKKTVRTGS